jgi:hypothetical protein
MSQFGIRAKLCAGKIGIGSSIQAQGTGEVMRRKWRSYGNSDTCSLVLPPIRRGRISRSVSHPAIGMPVPVCPTVRTRVSGVDAQTKTVREIGRALLPDVRQDSYACLRKCSASAFLRIANSRAALWETPQCCAHFRSNVLASELIRILVACFFIDRVYYKMQYMSSGFFRLFASPPNQPKRNGALIPRINHGGFPAPVR